MGVQKKMFDLVCSLKADMTIQDDEAVYHITIDAPDGKIWNANRGHSIVAWVYKPFSKIPVWDSLITDMLEGIDDCDIPECDFCENY